MFKMFGSLWAVLASLFTSLEDATGSLDNLVSETLLSSELSLIKKADEYENERKQYSITDDEVEALLNRVKKSRHKK